MAIANRVRFNGIPVLYLYLIMKIQQTGERATASASSILAALILFVLALIPIELASRWLFFCNARAGANEQEQQRDMIIFLFIIIQNQALGTQIEMPMER